ncbi:hypothetical protein [Alicycliphilus denitrificans]|uniref:hypothetical protein n=1 Tax=Alicycliphilus denitrificans TaxID=179636 RepID=UPI000C9F2982|nr:hypothetical protein [Alicycliphilus denitrificans]
MSTDTGHKRLLAPSVFSFEVWAVGSPHRRIINARSSGAARYDYLLDVRDCWPDAKYTDMRARKIGPAHTSEAFLRTARYRGMPDLRCGEAVKVSGRSGVVVGHNDSANFDVLFDQGTDWAGAVLNVHPSELRRAAAVVGEKTP